MPDAAPPRGRRESFVSIWGRRAISIPIYLALATIYFGLGPVLLLGGAVLDAVRGQLRRLPRTRALAFVALYLGCEILGIFAASLLGLATLGGVLIGRPRYLDANAALQRWWCGALLHGSVLLFSMKLEAEGLERAARGPLLLFMRHSSTADTVLGVALVAGPHRLALRYVLKRELLWDPCLDIVGRRLPNAFIDRRSPRREAELAAITELTRELDPRSGVLIYPEGTRFDPTKLERGRARLRSGDHPALADIADAFEHVLPPRLGGALALIDAAPEVDVLLVEHTGFEGAATFASFWTGALIGQTIRVRVRRIPAAELPPPADRPQWLFERWAEVDRWISDSSEATTPTQ